jgi:lysophospholipase L1-like esterase
MPNGESRNWIRFIRTLEGFYNLYGKWPAVMHLYPFFIDELQNKLSAKDFQTLQSKIRLVPDEKNPFLCFDEKGNTSDYARGEICPDKDSSVRAIKWLNISEPDYYD